MATSVHHPLSDEPKYTHLHETLKPHIGHFLKKALTPVRIESDEANPKILRQNSARQSVTQTSPKPTGVILTERTKMKMFSTTIELCDESRFRILESSATEGSTLPWFAILTDGDQILRSPTVRSG